MITTTVTVWRWEHEITRIGPYQHPGARDHAYRVLLEALRLHAWDGDGHPTTTVDGFDLTESQADFYTCACATEAQLDAWFSGVHPELLTAAGFVKASYDVPLTGVEYGASGTQVMFDYDRATNRTVASRELAGV